jgi:hypothetical protein
MNGGANRVEARKSEDGLATTQFRKIPRRLRRGASLSKNVLMTAQKYLGNNPSRRDTYSTYPPQC